MIRPILSTLALGLLAAQAHAQIPLLDPTPQAVSLTDALAGISGLPDVFETISADIDGSLDQDVISRFDGGLLVTMNVVLSSATVRIDMPITGMTNGPRKVDRNAILVSGPTGLSRLEFTYDGSTQQLSYLNPTVTDLAARDLSKLAFLRPAGAGNDFIVGVGPSGTTLVGLKEDPSAPTGFVVDPLFSPTLNGTVFDLCVVDFDGDGTRDFAMATSWGLEVVSALGVTLYSSAFGATSGSITGIADATQTGIAWARPASGGGSELAFYQLAGFQSSLPLGSGSVVSLSSGDFTSVGGIDDDIDLAICFDDSTRVLIAANVGGVFSVVNSAFLSNGLAPTTGNKTKALIADLDGDGAADFSWVDRVSQTLNISFNDLWPGHDEFLPGFNYMAASGPTSLSFRYAPSAASMLTFPEMPNGLSIRAYNKFEVPGGDWVTPGLTEPGAFFMARTALIGDPQIVSYGNISLVPDSLAGLPLAEFVTYVELRYIVFDPVELVTRRYPPLRFVIHQKDNQDQISHLLAENPGAILIDESIFGNGDQGGVGGIRPPDTPPPPVPVNPGP